MTNSGGTRIFEKKRLKDDKFDFWSLVALGLLFCILQTFKFPGRVVLMNINATK